MSGLYLINAGKGFLFETLNLFLLIYFLFMEVLYGDF